MDKQLVKLIANTKNLISKYPLLFYWSRKVLGINSGKICSKKTDIVLEGYPSSANSFTLNIFRSLAPKLNISSHTHSIASIKKGIHFNKPIFFIARNPLDAISSRVVRHRKNIIEAILRYKSLYSYVLSQRNNINVMNFLAIVNNTEDVIMSLCDRFAFFKESDPRKIEKEVLSHIKEYQKNKKGSGLLPTEEKRNRKKQVKEKLKSECNMELIQCEKLYDKITQYKKV